MVTITRQNPTGELLNRHCEPHGVALLAGLHTATLRFGYAEPLTPARFDLHAKLADLAQADAVR